MTGLLPKFDGPFGRQLAILGALMILNFIGVVIITLFLDDKSVATKAIAQMAMVAIVSVIFCWVLLKLNKTGQEAKKKISVLAHQDALTGLTNREAFLQHLVDRTEGSPRNALFALLLIDIDRFKELNAFVGYKSADQVLAQVAERLKMLAGSEADAARLNGDEFALIVSYDGSNDDLETRIQTVFNALYEPYMCRQQSVDLTFSVGVTLYPDDGQNAEGLNHNAYFALQRAKQEGHDRICCFDEVADPKLRDDHFLSQDMDRALHAGEFKLFYQPQYCFTTGKLIGFEALIRWLHKDRGMINPTTFIPIAEKNGFILPLSNFVLNKACETASKWVRPLKVAVNLSPLQMRQRVIYDQVQRILAETGLDPKRLELEVTESLFIDINEEMTADLNRLQKLGISIALDDFGTGYSSLSYLTSFPFNKIKIDRSFVRNLREDNNSMTIVSAIIGLGKSLETRITAEGIEDQHTYEMLRIAGCDEAQGFLLGKPRDLSLYPGEEMEPVEFRPALSA